MRNILFEENSNNIFLSDSSNLNLTEIKILNHNCFEILQGCVLNIYATSLSVNQLIIEKLSSYKEEGTLYFWKSNGTLINLKLSNVKNFKQKGSCLSIYESNLTLSQNIFYNYDSNCLFIQESILYLNNSIFNKNTNNLNGMIGDLGSIYGLNTQLYLENCIFNENRISADGAAIFLKDSLSFKPSLKSIKSSVFYKNMALKKGGGLYLKNQNLEISNCTFLENEAEQGGGIYLFNEGYIL